MVNVFRVLGLILLSILVLSMLYVGITFPPVMAGMAAKTMCSCVYVTGRSPESVREKELQVFPGLAGSEIILDDADSSVTAKIFWRTSKAIFRKGLGCTLLADLSEEEVRQQKMTLPSPLSADQDTLFWPMGKRISDSVLLDVNYETVNEAIEKSFIPIDSSRPVFTHAVIAVHNGHIIGEQYAPGFDDRSMLMGWSMTKSITNALIGILVNSGKLKIDAPAPIDEWQNDDRKNITLNNLLHATSGLSWSESYFVPTSDFHNMFIRSDDKARYALERKLKHEPGEYFQYSSGTANILSLIIRRTVGDVAYYRFPYEELFYKIGMGHTLMEPDPSGTFVGSSYSFATARDWARFGMLYLNDGVWNGTRIFQEGWVAYSTTPATAAPRGEYGAQWWLNQGNEPDHENRIYPELPADAFWADGFEEQYVMVIPSKNLVIVRLGVSHFGSEFQRLAVEIATAISD